MKTHATQRSLKHLRDNGWQVFIVEKYIKHPGMKFGVRQDVWGFGDLLACRSEIATKCMNCFGTGKAKAHPRGRTFRQCVECSGLGRIIERQGATMLVQCFPDSGGSGFMKHRQKILSIPEHKVWKAAGNYILLMGWGLRGPKNDKNWRLRKEQL